jgi:hypothetical protein
MRKKLLALAAAGVLALAACSDDDPYSEESRQDFMDECSASLDESQCECAWDEISENVPEEDARDFLESDSAETPSWLTDAFTACTQGG